LSGAALAAAFCVSFTATPSAEEPDVIAQGRSLFNQYCGHCHGPNAIQGERPLDLRRLTLRYGPQAPEVFAEAMSKGRLDKGMPVWKGALSDEALRRILIYLQTVQTRP
jgi:polar amino acid transport system substrate-binding protein